MAWVFPSESGLCCGHGRLVGRNGNTDFDPPRRQLRWRHHYGGVLAKISWVAGGQCANGR